MVAVQGSSVVAYGRVKEREVIMADNKYRDMKAEQAIELAISEIARLEYRIAQLEKENAALHRMLRDDDAIRQNEMRR